MPVNNKKGEDANLYRNAYATTKRDKIEFENPQKKERGRLFDCDLLWSFSHHKY